MCPQVPKVTYKIRCLLICLVVAGNLPSAAQSPKTTGEPIRKAGPAESLYEQLRAVGLDRSRVYRIRDASVDRASLHVSLNDGTIAFTQDVAGRVTGAFFEGDGEVLLLPADQVERSSMALFTGAAILEEKVVTAYLRFNDDTFKELQPFLRSRENSGDFISRWNDGARDLAQADALRLLTTFSRLLPVGEDASPGTSRAANDPNDRMLHLKIQGRRLGVFDLFFDLAAQEQISAGQFRKVDGKDYYDVWTSFAIGKEPSEEPTGEIAGEEGDQGEIEISSYNINASIEFPNQLSADARLHLRVLRGGERTVLFELSRYLKIRQVEADGHPMEFIHNQALDGRQLARRGDDLVAVVFPESLRTGQRIDLHFSYAGAVLSDAGGGLLYVGARGTWYPNRGFAKAAFDIEFRYPVGWTLIATGTREDDSRPLTRGNATSVPGPQLSRWVSVRPIPVAGFNLGKYTRVTKHAGSVPVEVYAAAGMERTFPQPEQEEVLPQPPVFRGIPTPIVPAPFPLFPAGNAQFVADNAVRAISFFASRFGPYPYHELAVTQMPGALSQGWPGLIFLSSFSFLSPEQKLALHMDPVQKTLSDAVIDHETAHQWWGDLITWSGYRDQWISEGLANYSSLLLLETENPSEFRAVMQKYRDDLLEKNKDGIPLMDAGPVTLGTRLSSSKFPDGYETIAYERGTWLFHMLRSMLSQSTPSRTTTFDAEQKSRVRSRRPRSTADEPFLRALRTLSEEYQGKSISTRELMHVFERYLPPSSGFEGRKSLDWFYQGWVNGTAIPSLELHSLKYSDKAGATLVNGIIKQKDAPESLITLLPIYASIAGKDILLGSVFADGPETQFHLTAPPGTRKILLDPDHTVLSRAH